MLSDIIHFSFFYGFHKEDGRTCFPFFYLASKLFFLNWILRPTMFSQFRRQLRKTTVQADVQTGLTCKQSAYVPRGSHRRFTVVNSQQDSLDLSDLEQLIQGSETVPLASHRSDGGDRSNRWGVVVNAEIEPDL